MTFPSSAEIARAAELLRAGELVAFPTETVYGLGANALDARAVDRIYEAKGRPATSPLIVHVSSVEMARGLASAWPREADLLAARWWPGPLTIVVPKAAAVPDRVTAGLPTVALRMPAHPVALALIEAARLPLAGPSANRFTELSPTTAEHVRRGLGGRVAMILDGGPCEVGIESTVISLAGPRPVLLRAGIVTRAQIESVVGELGEMGAVGEAHPSPGMHDRHYRPRTPLYLLPCELPPGCGITLSRDRMPADVHGYAQSLYATLHQLDQQSWDWIAVEPPPPTPEWEGVRDRLRRAAMPARSAG